MAIVLRIVVGFKDLPHIRFPRWRTKKRAKHGVGLIYQRRLGVLIVAWEEADLFAIMYQEYIYVVPWNWIDCHPTWRPMGCRFYYHRLRPINGARRAELPGLRKRDTRTTPLRPARRLDPVAVSTLGASLFMSRGEYIKKKIIVIDKLFVIIEKGGNKTKEGCML